ncbi:ATP-binding protein [Armatimonas sp.]|uniref:ATP-binding protein n=1 Tax=Armatimonas sp. TaxID=1872638 RepID=UPI00374CFD22
MPHPPEGTITFLFTDIEGSTRLWEEHPETMRLALARHDALLREAIKKARGSIFKTLGDAFCAAFHTAPDALSAALTIQRALVAAHWSEQLPLKVRMALHTGEAESRDNDYFGQPLNRVARLLSAAHGDQVLLSQTTYELVREGLPGGVSLHDLGSHQLKDLARPEQVYQLQHLELPDHFPPIKSLSTHPNNLPQQVTSFIGREKELADIKTQLQHSPLLTLTGSGGCGKTRLSLQVAADSLEQYPKGAWLVELASVSDPALVPQTLAEVLGVREVPGEAITRTLSRTLKDKQLLLVLDNCEHVLEAAARLTDTLIKTCPHLRILASSREALGITGESTYRVPSLSLPQPSKTYTAESLSHFEAVRLFIERAVAAKEDFTVTNQNAPALASVCYRLDGIPLAIELAAARVRAMPIEQIEERLDNRFRLLTGGSRTALPRQQTLRALIDWSYDLLEKSQQVLLCHLAVFAGGWTLRAAEAVCASEELESWEILDLLTLLVDKSLVTYEEREGNARYRLLETVRQYARDRLLDSGLGEAARDQHRDYFLALAKEAEQKLVGPEQGSWYALLEREHDNLRVALEFCLTDSNTVALGQALAGALGKFWLVRGHLTEGREWYDRMLEQPGGEARTRARADALHGAATLAATQNDYDVAESYNRQSLEIRREIGDKKGIGGSLNNLGNAAFFQGDHDTARAFHEESLAIKREIGDQSGISISLNNLGNIAHQQGDFAAAKLFHEESLAIKQTLGDRNGIASSLLNLANVAMRQDDNATARGYYQQSLRTRSEIGDKNGMVICLDFFANLCLSEGKPHQAAVLWGAAQALRDEIGSAVPTSIQKGHDHHLAETRKALGDAAFEAAYAQGRALTQEQAIVKAMEN